MSLAFCQSFQQKVTARPCAYGYPKGQGRDVEFYPPRQVLNFALYENLLSIVFSYTLPHSVWLLIFFKKKYESVFFEVRAAGRLRNKYAKPFYLGLAYLLPLLVTCT